MAVCINVLSMIDKDNLPQVLEYLAKHARTVLAAVNTWQDSQRICPAHKTLEQRPWWDRQFEKQNMKTDKTAEQKIKDAVPSEIDYWVYRS